MVVQLLKKFLVTKFSLCLDYSLSLHFTIIIRHVKPIKVVAKASRVVSHKQTTTTKNSLHWCRSSCSAAVLKVYSSRGNNSE